MTRVVVVSGIRLYREGLAELLGRRPGIQVVGVKCDRREVAADLLDLTPDIVIVDMATDESDATVRDIKRLTPEVPVVALGIPELEGTVLACVEAGVAGYVTREGSLDDLVRAVQNAARGEFECSPRIAGSLLRRVAVLTADREPPPSMTRLTTREAEILGLVDQNLSNKQIAGRLGIEVATVKNHMHNVLEKLNVHRRTDAARVFGRSVGWKREIGAPPPKRATVQD